VDTKIKDTMPKVFVIIVTINTEELKNLGIVHTKNYTQVECVKIATSICTTKRKENKIQSNNQIYQMSIH